MKNGLVNDNLEPLLRVTFVAGGRRIAVEMVVDTGFEGFASLPFHAIRQMRLPLQGTVPVVLADDSEITVEYYSATIIWNGRRRIVEVLMTDGDPLLGTSLLRGQTLHVDFVPGGAVSIRPLKTS
jgi:clan AA aspartic protease